MTAATASQIAPNTSTTCHDTASSTPRKVATPLPPLKLSQTGNRWPRKAPSAGEQRADRGRTTMHIDQHRDRALEHVGEQRRGGEALAAGAQHIGGADIAGADRADVLRAGEPREHEPERDRAEQIAERERAAR